MGIGLIKLLDYYGLDISSKIKMVRHKDFRIDVEKVYQEGLIEYYQAYQGRKIFECDYIVSLIGEERTRSRFFGIYRVLNRYPGRDKPLPPGFKYPEFAKDAVYYYELEKVSGFEELIDRVIVNWGKAAKVWCQKLKDLEIIEIYPRGYVKRFPGYLEFILTYQQLKHIIENPDANKIWHQMLSEVAGVYLLTDSAKGKLYVGSAYGEEGILGRWKKYAQHPSGGNKILKEQILHDELFPNDLNFSILHTLAKTLTPIEVIQWEVLFKNKLGRNAISLNSN